MFLARPEWVDWVAGLAPALTTVIAAVAVVIASKALKASQASAEHSRRSADHSAESVEKADAALRGSVRPILRVSLIRDVGPPVVSVENIGPGVAVSVAVTAAPVLDVDGALRTWGVVRNHHDLGPIAPGNEHNARLSKVIKGTWSADSHVVLLTESRDVNGELHWTEQHYRPQEPLPSNVGVGPLPERFARYFDPEA